MPFVTEVRGDTAFVRLPLPLIEDPHVERGVVRMARGARHGLAVGRHRELRRGDHGAAATRNRPGLARQGDISQPTAKTAAIPPPVLRQSILIPEEFPANDGGS